MLSSQLIKFDKLKLTAGYVSIEIESWRLKFRRLGCTIGASNAPSCEELDDINIWVSPDLR